MTRNVKLRRMGGSVGVTLPKEMAERYHLAVGDEVLAVETPHGILLTLHTTPSSKRVWRSPPRPRSATRTPFGNWRSECTGAPLGSATRH